MNQPPRIDIACFTAQSGLTDYTISLARALTAHAKVRLHTAIDLPERFRSMGFEVATPFRRSRHYPLDLPKFFWSVFRDKPDILLFQAHLKIPLIEAIFIKLLRICGVKIALTVHDVLPHYPKAWSELEFKLYYRCFDLLISHSRAAHEQLRKMGVDIPILVVPHGVYDLFNLDNPSQEASRARVGSIQRDDTVVLFFGHLEPRKGLLEFLEAAEKMQHVSNLKFLIAGGRSLHQCTPRELSLFESARRLPNVVMHDHRIPFEEVQYYLRASDIVALPYREGTTSGVLKLALAFGLPVVVSRMGDLPEQVPVNGGLIINAGPSMAKELEDAIMKILGNIQTFKIGMREASNDAQWPKIAMHYFNFLTSHTPHAETIKRQ
jgi:glycosyltransferase involved in cell wall biosynthesis